MRPLRLSLRAFGPFADEQVLDFALLGPRSFFLVHGPTGAGKTSILDGICYALYGESSGRGRDDLSLRSHFAAAEALTEVALDFALGAERYRVWRRLGHERPKRRGVGTTLEPAQGELWRRTDCRADDEPGQLLASKPSQVDERVRELLGFEAAQFRQVIMLPQGQFERFLLGDSKEREGILEVLFDTSLYARIQEAIKAEAKELARQFERLRADRALLLGEEGVSSEPELEALREQQRGAIATCQQRQAEVGERLAAAQQRLARAHAADAKLRELGEANAALTELRAADHRMAMAEKRAAAGRRAAVLQEAAEHVREAERRAAAAAKRRAELGGLLEQTERAVPQADAVVRTGTVELEVSRLRLAEAQRLAALGDARELQEAAATRQLAEVRALGRGRDELGAARARMAAAAAAQAEAEAEAARERSEVERLQQTWNQGQAAILAGRLEAGAPCPVCGSRDHPAPARSREVLPDQATLEAGRRQIRAAEAALRTAGEKTVRATAELGRVVAEVELLEQRLGELGSKPVAELEARRAQAQVALEQARLAAAAEVPAAEARCRELEQAIERARQAARAAGEALAARQAELGSATDEARVSREQALELAAALARRLPQEGFADVEAYRAACLEGSAIEELEQRAREYRERCKSAGDRAERAREAAHGLAAPDLGALEQEAERLAQESSASAAAFGAAGQRLGALDQRLEQVRELARAAAEIERQHQAVGTISEVAIGHNRLGTTFQRFVLGALLDDVLGAASHRLRLMSRGRYQLQRARERRDQRAAGGLDLEVFDQHTGRCRPVASLSGGECFQAALALALGLADAVQSYAGGIHLDTIFVDEGFGSLDPDALELALATLLDLQQGGRLVGIISHVEGLRERIDVRLEVTPGRAGSSARFVLP